MKNGPTSLPGTTSTWSRRRRRYTCFVAAYSFVSAWKISAPPEAAWEYIGDPLRWQLFWPGLEDVKLLGDASSSGAEAYEFVQELSALQGGARRSRDVEAGAPTTGHEDAGQLEGTGTVDLQDSGDGFTHSQMTWDTRSTLLWMNLSAPLLRGLFEWNHDLLMKRAGEGLARRLDAPVVEAGPGRASLARALVPLGALGAGFWAVARLRR